MREGPSCVMRVPAMAAPTIFRERTADRGAGRKTEQNACEMLNACIDVFVRLYTPDNCVALLEAMSHHTALCAPGITSEQGMMGGPRGKGLGLEERAR